MKTDTINQITLNVRKINKRVLTIRENERKIVLNIRS